MHPAAALAAIRPLLLDLGDVTRPIQPGRERRRRQDDVIPGKAAIAEEDSPPDLGGVLLAKALRHPRLGLQRPTLPEAQYLARNSGRDDMVVLAVFPRRRRL